MKAAFTPGPWNIVMFLKKHNGFTHRIHDSVDNTIVEIPTAYEGLQEETRANARLIAAAPDLLEACKYFVQCVENGITTESMRHCENIKTGRSVLREAKSAIAKAEAD